MEVAAANDWAVVIPNYNNADDSIACLTSIWLAQTRPDYVLLVDDASTDGTVEKILAWAALSGVPARVEPEPRAAPAVPIQTGLTILVRQVNAGFTIASNSGLRAVYERTNAPYVLLLNNDTAVCDSFFLELAAAIARRPFAGLATGTIYEWDRKTVWYAGGRVNPLRALASHAMATPSNLKTQATEFVTGCAMLISRRVLDRIGYLAVCYSPGYSEDVDYSLRTRAAGLDLVYAPAAVVYHRVGRSLGRHGAQPPRIVYVASRNRAFVIRRNYHGWRRAAGLAYLAITKPLRAVFDAVQGRPRIGWAVLSGTVDGLFNPIARVSG